MDAHNRLEDLRDAAAKLSIEIQTCDLADNEISVESGYCKLKGKSLILLDKRLEPDEQIEVILKALDQFDLETIYVAAWIRERLENKNSAEINP